MRHVRIFGCVCLIVGAMTMTARAQYGLFGAPDTLAMPAAQRPAGAPVYTTAPVPGPVLQTAPNQVMAPRAQPVVQPAPVAAVPPTPMYTAAPGYVMQPAPAHVSPLPAYASQPAPAPTGSTYMAQPSLGNRPQQTLWQRPALAPSYAAPSYPTTTRPVQVPAMAMYSSSPAPGYGVPNEYNSLVPQLAATDPAPTPAAAPTPAVKLDEPPENGPVAPIPQPQAGPSPSDVPQGNLINSMLGQPAGAGCNGFVPAGGPPGAPCGNANGYGCYGQSQGYFAGAVNQYDQAACGYGPTAGCSAPMWFGSVKVLTMGRDQANGVWTTYESGNLPNQLMNTRDVEMPWQWGGEVTFGRKFLCGCNTFGIEATYWTLDPSSNERTCTHPSRVNTPLIVSHCRFNNDSVQDWYAGADAHRLNRRNEFHNVEVNAIGFRTQTCEYEPMLGIDWLLGFRFFRFEEELGFASLRHGGSWSVGDEWARIGDSIENNLWGFQVGFNSDLRLYQGLKLFCNPKVGVYDNHIENNFAVYRGDGVNANTGSYNLGNFPRSSTTDKIAFLTEIDLGVEWEFTQHWSATVGYRIVAATGVGLADDQIPMYLVDIPEIDHIKHNGDLILHGAFAGVTYNY